MDGWEWRDLKAVLVSWYEGLADCSLSVEEDGRWPEGLLDADISAIPEVDGDATPWGRGPDVFVLVVYKLWASVRMGHLEEWFLSWVPDSVYNARSGRSSPEAWKTTVVDIEEVLSGAVEGDLCIFVADVVELFDTVDRGVLDRVLSGLGLLAWSRHAFFEYHAGVRLRFKLASGSGECWTGDGGILPGCPLSMMFTAALYVPWCRHWSALQLYADNLECVASDPSSLLRAARFTAGYVRLVGQEPAPSKCVLLCTSQEGHALLGSLRCWREVDR